MTVKDFGQKKILLWQGSKKRTIRRIATQLGRLSRFAGDLIVPCWSVLHHLVACAEMADSILIRKPAGYRNTIVFYALTHDLDEAWSNDIPTYFKNDQNRSDQKIVDINIYSSFGFPPLEGNYKKIVKEIDLKIMNAEASLLTPKEDWEPTVTFRNDEERQGYEATVMSVHASWPSPLHCNIDTAALVEEYLRMLEAAYREL